MIFARLEVDGKAACGVFNGRCDASSSLFEWALNVCNGLNPSTCTYGDKPYGEMTIQDDLDCHPLEVVKVLVSKIN